MVADHILKVLREVVVDVPHHLRPLLKSERDNDVCVSACAD